MINLILLDCVVGMGLSNLENIRILFDPTLDAGLLLVQLSEEAVSQLDHDVGKAKEQVGLKVLTGNDGVFSLEILLEIAVIYDREHLVHALDIFDSWVQLGIYEEDAMENVGTSIDVEFDIFWLEICSFCVGLAFKSRDILRRLVLLRVDCKIKIVHISPGSLDIFLNFVPYLLIFEEGVPYTRLGCRKRMVHHGLLLFLFFFLVLQLWLHDQLSLEAFIILEV